MSLAGALRENDGPFDGQCAPQNISPLAEMDESGRREFWAALALRHCPGLGPRKRAILLKHFGSAWAAFENVRQWGALGLGEKVASAIKSGAWRNNAQEEWNRAAGEDAGILLWQHAKYPRRLRELSDAPAFLYCRGDASLLESPTIAIVGSRQATSHGRAVAGAFGKALSSCGIVVISGMAGGIDSAAHAGALINIGKSIGVLGTGIDKIYPLANENLFQDMEREGLLISEFPPGTPPMPANFPIRNRIISGMALAVVVVEAATRSGSLITARYALEQNRDVFAVPSPALDSHSLGCQNLIRQGAVPVFCADDILRHLQEQLSPWKLKTQDIQAETAKDIESSPSLLPPPLPVESPCARAPKTEGAQPARPPEKEAASFVNIAARKLIDADKSSMVVEYLRKNGPMHVDMIANEIGMGPGELATLLVGLEMFGEVKRLPGARFEAAKK